MFFSNSNFFSNYSTFIVLMGLIVVSCGSSTDTELGKYTKGVFVVNQGKFPDGKGAISFYNEDTKTNEIDIYFKENATTLGNFSQSMICNESYCFITNAEDVSVVDQSTFKFIKSLSPLGTPRYFVFNDKELLVSSWDGKITGFDQNLKKTREIVTGGFPEKMLISQSKLYVTMSNGFGQDSFLNVYNIGDGKVEQRFALVSGPNSLALDNNNNLYVLCEGYFDFISMKTYQGGLYQIVNQNQKQLIPNLVNVSNLVYKNGILYFNDYSTVYSYSITTKTLDTVFTESNASFYGLAVSNDGKKLFISDAKDYASQGQMLIYDISTKAKLSIPTSVVPGQIYIR